MMRNAERSRIQIIDTRSYVYEEIVTIIRTKAENDDS